MNKKCKRIALLITVAVLLLALTGCTVPVDENGKDILITLSTSFAEMKNEGFFSAFLTYPLAQAINFLSPKMGVGIAIAVITLAVNAVILALTFKSNVGMQRMQEIQPELQKIQRKYEGKKDPVSQNKMGAEVNALYQKNHINPIGSLLVSFIQLPILFAVYTAVRRSEAVATGTFLGTTLSLTPVNALSSGQPAGFGIYLAMIIFQLISIMIPRALANRRKKMEADKHHRKFTEIGETNQQTIMTYSMVFFIGFIMLNWPVALSLYYCIFSIVNVIKTVAIDSLTHKG